MPGGYFSSQPPAEPFRLFGPAHLVALGVVGAGIASLGCLRGRRPETVARVKTGLVAAAFGQELFLHAWRAATGRWSLAEMLPMHACTWALWLGGVGALTGNTTMRDYSYYLGIAGATQALLTPDLAEYGPGNVQFAQFFASHGLIVAIPMHLVAHEGYRPTWAGAARTLGVLAGQGVLAYGVNRRVRSNYLFVSRKPATASLLDRLPPWPGYVPVLYALAAGGIAVLTLPFAGLPGRGRRERRRVHRRRPGENVSAG